MKSREHSATLSVFLNPTELCFYALTPATLRQSLSIYNPFHNPVKYEVLVLSESKCSYSVKDFEGIIPPFHHAELTVVNRPPPQLHLVIKEKLKIAVRDARTAKDLGYRIIPVTLFPSEKDLTPKEDSFKRCDGGDSSVQSSNTYRPSADILSRIYILTLCTALIAVLFVPTRQEPPQESFVPASMHVSELFKLICAFILGFITMAVLRPF